MSLGLFLLSGPARALSLQWDDSSGSWCAGTATCVDSPQAGGDYVAQAVHLAMGSDTVDLFCHRDGLCGTAEGLTGLGRKKGCNAYFCAAG
ncbi:MAG: hypothetical protein GXP62_21950, partial [Oligoflexia bacterium]|nr:hypothetical protein [Oligoflexia bacterium]